ncbi:NAD(P)-binding protein [Bacillus sp. B15-48]|nr:NAD(P)-binding protein [Bacillus sp. B15-48]
METNKSVQSFDAVVIGAGLSGLYMLHRLREEGFSTRVYEAAEDVGGVWYWNRYPGARCDSESIYYNFTFSEELYKEWTWTSKFAEQPEILRYINFVADRLDLRRDIQFNTHVQSAHYNERNNKWEIHLNNGTNITANYLITAVGCLSAANVPNFKGIEKFKGEWYHTGKWPHEEVQFKGKRVGIIGTGSSGIQAIPVIAKEADYLTVFQRTPQYSNPANNYKHDPEFIKKTKENFSEIKRLMRTTPSGLGVLHTAESAIKLPPEERKKIYEQAWESGGLAFQFSFADLSTNEQSNETACEFIRTKIKEIVKDPEVAKKLMPSYYFLTKRPVMDSYYFETYNRENVSLVDVKETPIVEITPKGIRTAEKEYELDMIVFATGYDAMTGPLLKIDIRGKAGISLKEKWQNGAKVRTNLGIATAGFPNLFMITGPESPSVLVNMPSAIEQHVEWISDCVKYLRDHDIETIEPEVEAEEAWNKHCQEVANQTLFPKTPSWYTGMNIEAKPRGFLIYIGGLMAYREKCNEVAANGYNGFSLVSNSTVNK